MRYKLYLILLLLFFSTLFEIYCQTVVRAIGREHVVLEVDRLEAEMSGVGCVWDFSGSEVLCSHNLLTEVEDSLLAVKFMRNIYRYKLDGDVLRWYSFENRLTRIEDSVGVPIIRFPFEYGDSLSGRIDMFGRYSTDTQCMETGAIRHMADARGTVILPDDTIRNVLRVKTVRSTKTMIADTVNRTVFEAKADSLPTFVQTDYRWYSDRFALPIASRSDMAIVYGDSTVAIGSLSLILESAYFLVSSEEFHEDKEECDTPDNYMTQRTQPSDRAVINRRADGTIEIQYRLEAAASMLETTVCDISGRVYYHSLTEDAGMGYHSETISLNGASSGQYLLVVKNSEDTIIKQLFEL